MKIFFSNRVETLFNRFKKDLFFSEQSPFADRLVVVPSPAVKTWLVQSLAKDFGVAFGLSVSFLEQTLSGFVKSSKVIPSVPVLSLAIEEAIVEGVAGGGESWDVIRSYLGTGKSVNARTEKRLIGLSEELTSLFQQYGIYGSQLIKDWENGAPGWQAELWRMIFCEKRYPWTYPAKHYLDPLKDLKKETHLYLFSLSYLSPIHHQFLNRVAEVIPINYYVLSPCQEFWSDILSDRESGKLQAYWRKRGIPEVQQQALEEYLSDRNPLLANYGRIGREMAKTIEDTDCEIFEDYWLNEKETLSLLEAIQNDLVEMRNPAEESRQNISSLDNSIQVHSVTGHLREVEVVRDLVLQLIDQESLLPQEIIVMAPHISEYAPYIKYVFGGNGIDYQLMDLSSPMQHEGIQAFIELLELSYSRFDVLSIISLIEKSTFREKLGISRDSVEQIVYWLRETGIHWGFDGGHRQSLIQDDYGTITLCDKSSKGTWDDGIRRLLLDLVENEEGLISNSQTELLGILLDLLSRLRRDLHPIISDSKQKVEEWVIYLKGLMEIYLEWDDDVKQIIFSTLDQFAATPIKKRFGFRSIYKRIKALLEKQQGGYRESHLHTVRFCSMLPMRAIPVQAIILMGMHEGVFPKKETNSSLNACYKYPEKVSFCPTITDYDRFLFLESILSARKKLYFTFQSVSKEDGKEQPSNILLQELMHYIEKNYGVSICPKQHFEYGFAEETLYNEFDYVKACAHYQEEKMPRHVFLKSNGYQNLSDDVVDLKDLIVFGRNPLRTYLNKALDFYMKKEEEELLTHECFEIDPLKRHILKKVALEKGMEEVFSFGERKAMFSPGLFGELEREKLKEEIEAMQIPSSVFSITLSEDCQFPEEDGKGGWKVPPLEVFSGKKIVGTFREVSEEGLFLFMKADKVDLIKAWPAYLVFFEVVRRNQISIGTNAIFSKNGKKKEAFFLNGESLLNDYLDYFFQSQKEPSQLLPEWVYPILYEDDDNLQKKIDATIPSYDVYINWLYRGNRLPKASEVRKKWSWKAEDLFADMLEKWS